MGNDLGAEVPLGLGQAWGYWRDLKPTTSSPPCASFLNASAPTLRP